jgi:RND family efflux transporter MFP subunit
VKKSWPWILGAVALAALAFFFWLRQGPVAVTIASATRGPAIDAIYATGTVEPTVMLPIAPRTGARLVELNADEGDRVRKGQVLARLDDADLASTVEELEARARYARAQNERSEDLVRKGFMAKAETDRTRSELDAADAAVKRARSQRDYMSLTAPAEGLIIKRDGERGQFIAAGQAVFFLSCCAPLRVSAEVDEEDIGRVHVGQKAVLRADALPGEVLDGKVKEITPKGDPVARSYRVRIELDDPERFKVGMTVDANLIVAERQDALLVPATAVQEDTVWTVDEKNHLRRHKVRVGVSGAGRTEILEGIPADARIVDSPPADLKEGRAAREKKAEPEKKKPQSEKQK